MSSLLPPLFHLGSGCTSQALPLGVKSLLVQGNYPASAVIHYAVSSLTDSDSDDSKVLVLSPSKDWFQQTLLHFNDKWLNDKAGNPPFIALLERIQIFYPPTLRLWSLILARLASKGRLAAPTIKKPPLGSATDVMLLLLHEPSHYFTTQENDYTISSYIKVISQAFDAANHLSQTGQIVRVALFDSGLQHLKLPLVRSPQPSVPHDEVSGRDPPGESVAVAAAAQRYFHWFGTVKEHLDSDPFDLSNALKELRLSSNEQPSQPNVKLAWKEERTDPAQWTDLRQTQIAHVDP